MSDQQQLEAIRMPFGELLGIKIMSAVPERVTAEMMVRPELCTDPAVLHGGALMAFADTLGAYATFLNLRDGQGTTTIESKTNFLAPAPVGHQGERGVRRDSSRQAHDGVADAHHLGAGPPHRHRHADADGARSAGAEVEQLRYLSGGRISIACAAAAR